MISISVSESDNIGLSTLVSYVRGMLECSSNPTGTAIITVCCKDNTEALTIYLDKPEGGIIKESYEIYKPQAKS